jgi:hypothetical protein
MGSRISRRFWRILTSVVLVSLTSITAIAQDPDPNSPTPVLLSERDSTRALAGAAGSIRGVKDLTRAVAPAFHLGDTVDIFVTNLDLMEGEGANAFRVYALDKVGHQFRFPVIALSCDIVA